MPRKGTLDDRLAALDALRGGDVRSRESIDLLRRALAAKTGVVVEKAVSVIRAEGVVELLDDLVATFERLCAAPSRADPGCRAKTAIAEALVDFGEEHPAMEIPGRVLLPGARHVQSEPTRGGQLDTAADLRSASAAGLVRLSHPQALTVLADHLADPVVGVREAAAKILAWRGVSDAVPLLRLRVGLRDDPRVLLESLRALLALDPEGALPLATARLEDADEETFAAAALALGESRSTAAFEALARAWETTIHVERRAFLATALVCLRRAEARDFLLDRLGTEPPPTACAVLEALATGRGDEKWVARIAEAVARRGEERVRLTFERIFR